ncbi:MAG: ABC transporter substrate-binding protein [Bacteroidales bacterium]|nr:ABC transporter substrate-binding protein [Bacteroidales bacterium]
MGTFVVLFTLAFQSCPRKKVRTFDPYTLRSECLRDSSADYIYTPRYAHNFCIVREDGEKILYLRNPVTETETKHAVKKANRVICLSSTHVAFLDVLNETNSIVGVSGLQYIYNKRRLKAKDIGYESGIDYEALLQLNPDVVFAYDIPGQAAEYLEKIRELGLNVIEIPEHLEEHPLGRAEFLVAFATFFNKEEQAAEIFSFILQAYEDFRTLALQAATLAHKSGARPSPGPSNGTHHSSSTDSSLITRHTSPTDSSLITRHPSPTDSSLSTSSAWKKCGIPPVKVLINAPFKDIWYIPGTESHQNIFVEDAGGVLLGTKPGSKTAVISTEQAYLYALEADFWIHPNQYSSLSELLQTDPRFAEVPVCESKQVWNNNRRTTTAQGSDYYESGVVNPHLILADLIAIFYPNAIPNHKFTYYRQLR